MPDPRPEILARLAARRAEVARQDRRDARLAGARLAVFAIAAGLSWLAFGPGRLSASWLALPALVFLALAVVHDRAIRARARARRAVAFHEAILARLEERWAGSGVAGEALAPPDHLYAQDLDLFGRASLFELLCAARTRPGEERLAAWLLSPAEPGEIGARQGAVRDLAPRLDLREDLAVLGDDVRAGVDAASLARWGEATPLLPGWLRPAALAVAAASVATAVAWATGLTGGL
ncbi:MAG TPA: DNA mismatch repair protein MutS, partial [Anaeromyxobacteraceae bacterium]|nr:DNA mismatch repair protein MutS [Anaeromyxobacteraceae bacterium]